MASIWFTKKNSSFQHCLINVITYKEAHFVFAMPNSIGHHQISLVDAVEGECVENYSIGIKPLRGNAFDSIVT